MITNNILTGRFSWKL